MRDAGYEFELLPAQSLGAPRGDGQSDGHRAEEDQDERGDGDLAPPRGGNDFAERGAVMADQNPPQRRWRWHGRTLLALAAALAHRKERRDDVGIGSQPLRIAAKERLLATRDDDVILRTKELARQARHHAAREVRGVDLQEQHLARVLTDGEDQRRNLRNEARRYIIVYYSGQLGRQL